MRKLTSGLILGSTMLASAMAAEVPSLNEPGGQGIAALSCLHAGVAEQLLHAEGQEFIGALREYGQRGVCFVLAGGMPVELLEQASAVHRAASGTGAVWLVRLPWDAKVTFYALVPEPEGRGVSFERNSFYGPLL